jgi:hypothetical protein
MACSNDVRTLSASIDRADVKSCMCLRLKNHSTAARRIRQTNTPAVSCIRLDTSPRWWSVSPNVISSWVSFLK